MSMLPLPDWNDGEKLPETDFSMKDDPFALDGFLSEFPDYAYDPLDEPFVPASPVSSGVSVNGTSDEGRPSDGGWSWHDAALVGLERASETGGMRYEVGCVDLYAHAQTGDLGGNYLKMGSFADVDRAADFYHEWQRALYDRRLLPFEIAEFATRTTAERAAAQGFEAPSWTACSPAEYAAYEEIRTLDAHNPDAPPAPTLQDLLNDITGLGGANPAPPAPETGERGSTFQALRAIGIEAEGFNPDADPPPFFDAQTHTAYWIGVFQPDPNDPSHCVASILSLARASQTGEVEARLAPCVPGDWDKAYQACEHLLDAVAKGGIERCFDTARSMALATDQREWWEKERGAARQSEAVQDLAAYTRSAWAIDL